MSWQAKGLYRELLDEFWSEGVLPRDHALLADICGCTLEEFERHWPEFSACWIETEDGLENPKMDEQRTATDRARVAMSKGGKKGGEASNSFTRAKAEEAYPKPTLSVPQAQPDIAEQSRALAEHEQSRAEKRTKAPPQAAFVLPAWIDNEDWAAYMDVRQAKRAAKTARALNAVVRQLEVFRNKGHSVSEVLGNSVRGNWTDVYEPKRPTIAPSKNPPIDVLAEIRARNAAAEEEVRRGA